MGTSCERGIHVSRKEEHELEEKMTKSEMKRMRRLESKEQDRAERRVKGAQHSVVGTQDETTAGKIKEVQAEREPLRQAILDFGRHRGKTYEWVYAHDEQSGLC